MASFSPLCRRTGLAVHVAVGVITSILLSSPVAGQVDCNTSHTVTSQVDVDNLYQCADFDTAIGGDLRISSDASGSLEIRNVGAIAGNIILEDNDSLETLLLETEHGDLRSSEDGISLIISNATALTEVSGGVTASFATIEMRDVTTLKTIQLPDVPALENLRLINCELLHDFTLGPGDGVIASNIELNTVGLRQFEDFFHRGVPGQNITLGGLMREDFLFYSLYDAHSVKISTDGPRTLWIDFITPEDINEEDPPSELRVESLEVSRVEHFEHFVSDSLLLPSVGTLNIHDTEILHLQVRVRDLSHLIVHDNPVLQDIQHGPEYADYSWKSISFRNNREWRPEIRNQSHDEPDGGWVWPSQQLESIELQGHFGPDIFAEWIERGKQSEEPLVTKKFSLETFSREEDGSVFDCGPLDDLHEQGILQGEYSCKGVDENAAPTFGERGIWMALLPCVFSILFTCL